MRDVATFTRVTPNQRALALKKFCDRVNNTPEAHKLLSGWGLTLEQTPVTLEARQLPPEMIVFGNNRKVSAGPNADFGKYATSNQLLEVIHLTDWLLLHTRGDRKAADAFQDCMLRNSKPMGIMVYAPKVVILDGDSPDTYAQALRKNLTASTQIAVCICPTARDDRYAVIKKICCCEAPVASQVSVKFWENGASIPAYT